MACLSAAQETNSTTASKSATALLGDLAGRIGTADLVVVTNLGVGIQRSVSGDEARKIIQAVASSQAFPPDTPPCDCVFSWRLQFFSHTNRVAAVDCCDDIFWLGDRMYRASGEVLPRLFGELQRAYDAANLRRDEETWFAALHDKEEARLWLTNSSHSFFTDRRKALGFVDELYEAGASSVLVSVSKEDKELIVVLPQQPAARRKVFAVEERHRHDWLPSQYPDLGQKYLWYPFR